MKKTNAATERAATNAICGPARYVWFSHHYKGQVGVPLLYQQEVAKEGQ